MFRGDCAQRVAASLTQAGSFSCNFSVRVHMLFSASGNSLAPGESMSFSESVSRLASQQVCRFCRYEWLVVSIDEGVITVGGNCVPC